MELAAASLEPNQEPAKQQTNTQQHLRCQTEPKQEIESEDEFARKVHSCS